MKNCNFFLSIIILLMFSVAGGIVAADEKTPVPDKPYLEHALELEENDTAPTADILLPNVFSMILRFFFSIILIVVLITGCALLYKKIVGSRYLFGADQEAIRVIAHKYLDTRKSIYIISAASKMYIIGATADQLNLISEITDPEAITVLMKDHEERSQLYATPSFKRVLDGTAKTYPGQQQEKQSSARVSSRGRFNLQEQIEKIKRMMNAR